MRIIFKDTFIYRLENQLEFIARNNPANSRKFKNELFNLIKAIPLNPRKHRKSIWYDDTDIRDLIFKSYTVVFRINNNTIIRLLHYVRNDDSVAVAVYSLEMKGKQLATSN